MPDSMTEPTSPLSDEARTIVEATAGVVAAHAEQITGRFYPAMFAAHPELLRVFNQGNQASGEQRKALAASVVAFALSLIDPDAPPFDPVLERIAHKHVSLGIRPEQYTIVGRHLMAAVGEVLGDAVTPEVARAWDEVYWLFAVRLVAREAQLYAAAGIDPAHPWRRYRVVQRVEEAHDVISLMLRPMDREPVPPHRPGQYVSVAVDLPDGRRQPRQYTVSTGARRNTLHITVRRERGTDGRPPGEVSTFLHEHAWKKSELDVSAPMGDVFLSDGESPVLLISAGVGITPIAAMLDDLSLISPERQVQFLHADRSPEHHPLYEATVRAGSELEAFSSQLWYEELDDAARARGALQGLMDLSVVAVPKDAEVFLCGPAGFMTFVRRQLVDAGVDPANIRYEVFGPDMWAGQPA
ncbi:MAG TPA: globin domain-containing protein [Dermatophilaceae bacterium]|nr:globin domain-containing protein [Dermatophilaceae bacterium]